jgi:Cytochrome P460
MKARHFAVLLASILALVLAVVTVAQTPVPNGFAPRVSEKQNVNQLRGSEAPNAQSANGGSVRPQYTSDGELEVPKGFRSWVFVGADLSPEYKPDKAESTQREQKSRDEKPVGAFHNIYINRESYEAYRKDGRFPDPTILVMEVFQAERNDAKGILKSGQFEGKRVGLEAAIKDRNRPGGGVSWAYYDFELSENGQPAKSARAFPDKSCYECHLRDASTDNVWVQFYPALRDPE